jgi:hypothetical protein
MYIWDENLQEWVDDGSEEQVAIPPQPPSSLPTHSELGGAYIGSPEGIRTPRGEIARAQIMAELNAKPTLMNNVSYEGQPGVPPPGGPTAEIIGYGGRVIGRKPGEDWMTPGGEVPTPERVADIQKTISDIDRMGLTDEQTRAFIKAKQESETGIVPRKPTQGDINIVDFVNFHMAEVEPKLREQVNEHLNKWESGFSYSTRSLMAPGAFDLMKGKESEKIYNELRNEEKVLATQHGQRLQRMEDEKRLATPAGFTTDNRAVTKNPKTGRLVYSDTGEEYRGGSLKPITDTNAGNKIPEIGTVTGTTPPGVRNEAALEGLNAGQAATVKGLVDYTIPLPSGMALRNPEWQAMLGRAAMYDTSFDAKEYAVRMSTRRDFSSGNAAKNARSLNTAVHHLDTLKKAGDELQNRSLQWWNAAANYGLEKIGDSRPTKFLTTASALSGELANVFKNTSGTDQEIKEWHKNISAAQSPEQIKGNTDTIINLIAGRLAALTNQYEKAMGKPKDFTLLSERSRKILESLGAKVDDLDPVGGKDSGRETKGSSRTIVERRKTASGKILTKYSDGSIE